MSRESGLVNIKKCGTN